MVGWNGIVWISTGLRTRFLESVNQVDVDLRDEKEAVFLGRCRHHRFQVADSLRLGVRKRTKSAMADPPRSVFRPSVDVPVTYLGIAGRQVSLQRIDCGADFYHG